MAHQDLPQFAYLPGQLVWERQLKLQYVTDLHFIFSADPEAIQHTVDHHLNAAMGIPRRFKARLPFVAIHFQNCSCTDMRCAAHQWRTTVCPVTHCARAWAGDAANRQVMALKFNRMELAIFVHDENDRVYRYVPYSFIDDGTALAVFRETMGLKMTLGEFEFPEGRFDPAKPGIYACHAHMDKVEKPDLWVDKRAHMLRLEPVGVAREAPSWKSYGEAWAGIAAVLHTRLRKEGHKHPQRLQQLIQAVLQTHFSLSLKQFRGMPDGVNAFYKALISYGYKRVRFHEGGVIGSDYALSFPDYNTVIRNNFPMADDLGLEPGGTSLGAFWTRSDSQYYLQEVLDDIDREDRNRF